MITKINSLQIVLLVGVLVVLGWWTISAETLTASDMIGATVCHRLSSHAFSINGRPMPLCARCSGIYLGVLTLLLFVPIMGRTRYAAFPERKTILFFAGLVGIMGFDGINSTLHFIGRTSLYTPTNGLRLATGFGAGIVIATLVATIFAQTAWHSLTWRPIVGTARELFGLLIICAVIMGLILTENAFLLYLFSIASAFAVVLILTLLYTSLVLIFRGIGRYSHRKDLLVPLCAGFLIALIQMGALATWRYHIFGTLAGF